MGGRGGQGHRESMHFNVKPILQLTVRPISWRPLIKDKKQNPKGGKGVRVPALAQTVTPSTLFNST